MVLIGCYRSVAPVKDADVAGLVPSWCATSHRRQRRRRHQPRRRRQATLGFDRPQDSNATGVPDDSATPLVSESVLGVFLGSPAATPRLESETPVAFDLRSARATRRVRHKMYPGYKYKFNNPESLGRGSLQRGWQGFQVSTARWALEPVERAKPLQDAWPSNESLRRQTRRPNGNEREASG